MAQFPKVRPRTKHIAVKFHHFLSHVQTQENPTGVLQLHWIPSGEQQGDIFTKPLQFKAFTDLRSLISGWWIDCQCSRGSVRIQWIPINHFTVLGACWAQDSSPHQSCEVFWVFQAWPMKNRCSRLCWRCFMSQHHHIHWGQQQAISGILLFVWLHACSITLWQCSVRCKWTLTFNLLNGFLMWSSSEVPVRVPVKNARLIWRRKRIFHSFLSLRF